MKILIIDDNLDFSSTLADIVASSGYETAIQNSPSAAINYMARHNSEVSLILLDIEFGFGEKMNGLDLLEIFHKKYISIPVVMVSGKGTIQTAVRATKLGAVNFIEKNLISSQRIGEVINATLASNSVGEKNEIKQMLKMNGIIGSSAGIIKVGEDIVRFGRTDMNILVTGAVGTGKRLVANAIHNISRYARGQFVIVDIPNIQKDNFQKELFGYVNGFEKVNGFFQQANKGTLFLDEIANLPIELQSILLVPSEDKMVKKIGDNNAEHINTRIVSKTNKDLLKLMNDGTFQPDLYHRLRECEIYVPTLNERKEDIPELVAYFTTNYNEQRSVEKNFSPSAISFLSEQQWLGNVRELHSFILMALQTIRSEDIEASAISKLFFNKERRNALVEHSIAEGSTLKADLAEVDKIKIEQALTQMNGNVTKTAAMLGVSRETLHNKIRRHNINVSNFRIRK